MPTARLSNVCEIASRNCPKAQQGLLSVMPCTPNIALLGTDIAIISITWIALPAGVAFGPLAVAGCSLPGNVKFCFKIQRLWDQSYWF
jgi:hypothetical protein